MTHDEAADEDRAKYIKKFGRNLGSIYIELHRELAGAYTEWLQYKILFKSPAVVERLNSVAGLFFFVVQKVLEDGVLLHIARLTDPPQSWGRENLTVQRLPDAINDPQLAKAVRDDVKRAIERCKPIREWRNRRLAHTDLDANSSSNPLPEVTRKMVEDGLESLRAVLNRLNGHYFNHDVRYEQGIISNRDARALIYHIDLALGAKHAGPDPPG